MKFNKADSMEFKLSLLGRDYRLSRSFKLWEFQSKDGSDTVMIHPMIIVAMQSIRDEIGVPLFVNSGFRTVEHNKNVGGSANSLHMYGMAVDLSGADPDLIAKIARKHGYVARPYKTFCHVDIGNDRTW
jgi:zinc D-Ala-D-Ala carboxypeptidase